MRFFVAPNAPNAPIAPIAPVAPIAPIAPIALIAFMSCVLALIVSGCKREGTAQENVAALVPGREQAVGDDVFMLMHRIQVNETLGDGWHRAASTEGGFSVELPLAFNDFRTRAKAEDGVEMRTHSVGGKTAGLVAWSATCIARRDGKTLTPDEDKMETLGAPVKAHQRVVTKDGVACVLIVEAQGSDPLPPEGDRLRFLHSLRRTAPTTW